jgi:sec-independent protein translocase protein TatA
MGELFAPSHLIWILLIVILLFGSKKIPDLAKGFGEGIKEFKKAAKDVEKETITAKIVEIKPSSEKKES